MNGQRFERGDLVEIVQDFTVPMHVFERGAKALVLSKYSGRNQEEYKNVYDVLDLSTGRETIFYYPSQFKFLDHIEETSLQDFIAGVKSKLKHRT